MCEKQIPVTIFYLSNNFDNAVRSDSLPVGRNEVVLPYSQITIDGIMLKLHDTFWTAAVENIFSSLHFKNPLKVMVTNF